VRVSEILGGLRERGNARRVIADLLMRVHDADAHGRMMASVEMEHRRHSGAAAPDPASIDTEIRHEARDVYGWSNAAGDTYAEHEHAYTKLLYCISGSIDFVLADGRRVALQPGDGLVLPPRTRHSAIVGPKGCACVEGKLPP
jgi:quercetin dioxygenase-like cupin family protein